VKTVVSILFSVLLLVGQTVFSSGAYVPGLATKESCACTQCAKSCCQQSEAPAQPTQPAMPAGMLSQEGWQLLAAQVIWLVQMPATKPAAQAVHFSVPSSQFSVPLYERNCSYLI
jgi:hypothetical protein